MKIIVSGGGTGGHIYPALTLIRTIQRRVPEAEFLYVGTNEGLEADIIKKEGIPFKAIDVKGFKRSFSLSNILRAGKAMGAVVKALGIISDFQPDVAIGTGGYVCGPILMAASLSSVPALVQEQNAVAGITNKILSKFVKKIAVGMKEGMKHFPKEKTVFTGNPIRAEVISAKRDFGLKEFGLDRKKKTLLVSGGSRGARSINKAMIGVIKHYANSSKVQILHITGKDGYEETIADIKNAGIDLEDAKNIIVKPYLYNMPFAMATADIAVSRAGAIGIAELTARGIPSVLIPYPYAAENHQEFNARAVERNGAARVILDKDLTKEKLLSVLAEHLTEEEKLKRMSKAAKALGRPKAADEIAAIVIELAKKKGAK